MPGCASKVARLHSGCRISTAKNHGLEGPCGCFFFRCVASSLQTLAEGMKVRRGIILSIAGDLQFFSSEFQFPTAVANYPCAYCCAKRLPRLNFSDICAGGEEHPVLKHEKGRRIRYFSAHGRNLGAETIAGCESHAFSLCFCRPACHRLHCFAFCGSRTSVVRRKLWLRPVWFPRVAGRLSLKSIWPGE